MYEVWNVDGYMYLQVDTGTYVLRFSSVLVIYACELMPPVVYCYVPHAPSLSHIFICKHSA
jgi:hypothetical protein